MNVTQSLFSRFRIVPASCFALMYAAGCAEPNYRNEVVSNGQGQVEVHRVAKDTPSSAAPVVSSPSAGPVAAPQRVSIDQRIFDLETQVEKLNAEITKLKLQKESGAATP